VAGATAFTVATDETGHGRQARQGASLRAHHPAL